VSNERLKTMLGVCRRENEGFDDRYVVLEDLRDDLLDSRARVLAAEARVEELRSALEGAREMAAHIIGNTRAILGDDTKRWGYAQQRAHEIGLRCEAALASGSTLAGEVKQEPACTGCYSSPCICDELKVRDAVDAWQRGGGNG